MTDLNRHIIHTIINFRFNSGNLKPNPKKLKQELIAKYALTFTQYDLFCLHKAPEYINEVFTLIKANNLQDEIIKRAKSYKKSPIVFIASAFNIDIETVAKYAPQCGIADTTVFKKDFGGRATSNIRRNENKDNKDCVVRSLSLAIGISYDNTLTQLQKLQKTDPTTGTYFHAWSEVLQKYGWECLSLKPLSKKYTVANLIAMIPKLADIRFLAHIDRHLFFVDYGVIRDSQNDAHKTADMIIVHKSNKAYFLKAFQKLTSIGEANELLQIKRSNPNISWTKIYDKMNILRQDGYRIRRSMPFQLALEANEQNWILKPAR